MADPRGISRLRSLQPMRLICQAHRYQEDGFAPFDAWPHAPGCLFLHFALRFPALCVRGARRVQPEHKFREYDTKDDSAEVPLQVFGGVMETPNALASKNEFVP